MVNEVTISTTIRGGTPTEAEQDITLLSETESVGIGE